MRSGATYPKSRVPGLLGLGIATLVAACVAPHDPTRARPAVAPEIYELANMRHSNIVPKSSPKALVAAFRKYCLGGQNDPARLASSLRAADYVAVPKTDVDAMTAFVVDDSRPMVMLSPDGRTCAVGAAARTGQTTRIRSMIAQQFPGATPLDPAKVGSNTEFAVQAPGVGVIFVQRLASSLSNSRLILGVWRGQYGGAK